MLNDFESMSNDTKVYEIAKQIDNEFFLESIREQIMLGLDATTTDYLNKFNIKFKQITSAYPADDCEELIQFREELLRTIINMICEKYGVEVNYDIDELENIANSLYQFFVIDMKDIVVSFISTYILENYKSIVDSIGIENLKSDFIPESTGENEKCKLIIAANLGKIIEYVSELSLGFDEFVRYAEKYSNSKSIVEFQSEVSVLANMDCDNAFNCIMRSIRNNEFDHSISLSVHEIIVSNFDIIKEEVSINGIEQDTQEDDDEY